METVSKTRTELGRIKSVTMGFGGYQDAMFGITFDMGGEGWGVADFWGFWASAPSENAQWNVDDQELALGKMSLRVIELLSKAKVDDVSKLRNVPIEVTFDGNALKAWRVLTEVL